MHIEHSLGDKVKIKFGFAINGKTGKIVQKSIVGTAAVYIYYVRLEETNKKVPIYFYGDELVPLSKCRKVKRYKWKRQNTWI